MVPVTEAELDTAIKDLCSGLMIWSYHPRWSLFDDRGWPDRSYLGGRGALFRELKSALGRLTHEQRVIGYRMQAAGLDWAVWRPADLRSGRIKRELEEIA